MNEQAKQVLTQIAVETLERLAFIFAFPAQDDAARMSSKRWRASVSFSGPFSGRLVMALEPADLIELAGNMLGVEEGGELSIEQQADALKETLNVLCGNILPALAGREAVFDLDPPQVDDKPAAPTAAGSVEVATVQLTLDEGICALALYVDEPVPEGVFAPDAAGGG